MQHPRLNFPLDTLEWKEGMLLAPQHFQQEVLRTAMATAYHAQLSSPFHWGVVTLEIDEHRLASGVFRVGAVEGLMPDGLPFRHDPTHGELLFDLRPHAAKLLNTPTTIYLSITRFVEGRSLAGQDGSRFALYETPSVRDLVSAGIEIGVTRLRPSLVLHLGEAPESYVALPIARIEVRNEAFTLTDFLPPLLRVPETSPLIRSTKELAGTLRRRAQILDDRQQQLQLSEDFDGATRLCRQVEVMVSALPQLEAIVGSKVMHPFALYLGLTGLLGPLASLLPGQVPPELPGYDHWNPRGSFGELFDALKRLLDRGTKDNFLGFRFKPEPASFTLQFKQEWLNSPIILSVQRRRGVTDDALREWMKSAVIASRSRIDELRQRRIPGLTREWIDRFEELLPTRDTLLFQLTPDRTFLRDGEEIVVYNREEGEGSARPSDVVLYIRRPQPQP